MNRKKNNPRTEFIIVRLTKQEKAEVKLMSGGKRGDDSNYIRSKLGFNNKND